MSFIDAKGKEHKLLVADQDLIVTDPVLGFDRQIIAGQHVPPDLEAPYREKAGIKTDDASSDEETSSSRGRKGAAKADGEKD